MDRIDLKTKHQIEQDFHDARAKTSVEDFYGFGALQEANDYVLRMLGNLRGKNLLEIGCGDGSGTMLFANAGAIVTALDISGEMVELTKRVARDSGVEKQVTALHMGVEDMDFPDNTFDIVYGHSVLHHLNLEIAISKIARVLKQDGIAAFLEPLDHNPILNVFRFFTPNRRTPTERPLNFSQLNKISRSFSRSEHREFYLFSLGAFIWYYGVRNKSLFRLTMQTLSPLDSLVFRAFPYVRRFAWVTVLRYTK